MPPPMDTERRSPGISLARLLAGATVAALVVQFLLGMQANLYVHTSPIEASHGSGGMMGGMMPAMSQAMSGASTLMLHMMLGWLLVILALASLLGAAVVRNRPATVLAAVGLGGILLAGYGGLQFMVTGHDGYSFLMATGFIVAVAAYFWEAYELH